MSSAPPAPGSPCSPAAAGNGFADLVDELRALLDAVCAAAAPAEVNREVSGEFHRLSSLLREYAVDDDLAPAGHRPDLPGEGHPLVPPIVITQSSRNQVRAEVTFRRAHVGSGNAVHGGLLPLVYDDVLGRLAQRVAASVARTAYLRVDYRAVTPVGRPLVVEGGVERLESRKIYIWGRMTDADVLLTEASALFVIVRDVPQTEGRTGSFPTG